MAGILFALASNSTFWKVTTMQLSSIGKMNASQPGAEACSTRRIATAQANRTRDCGVGMGRKLVACDGDSCACPPWRPIADSPLRARAHGSRAAS